MPKVYKTTVENESAIAACGADGPKGQARRLPMVTFQSTDGRRFAYGGKRGTVLAELATGDGITPHDCWRLTTRLSATVKVFRNDGLTITTDREGAARYARYRLVTPGQLVSGGGAND